jgi:EAL domain-containing protein (putative c-di-GMP-specific phosphodiesterase class I)
MNGRLKKSQVSWDKKDVYEEVGEGKTLAGIVLNFKKNIYYQPIVDAATSRVLFYESLLRFVGEDDQVFSPASFVQRAEADGSIVSLDVESLSMVFSALSENPSLNLSVNVSCFSLEDPLWISGFYEAAKTFPHVLARLIVEVTETQNFGLSQEACHHLRRIRSMGVRLALDDVDQVAFPCLQARLDSGDFAVDFLKISRHLTMDLEKIPDFKNRFSDLMRLASHHGVMLIIEGVETKPQCDALCAQGLFLQQGYYWGRPASVFKQTFPF